MRFQNRDGEILEMIYAYGGVVAKRHIKTKFWPTATKRSMEQRLAKLFHSEYISWPDLEQRKTKPIPEPICWLNWRGALYLAKSMALVIEAPKKINENQLRDLQKQLRKANFKWVREPHWLQLNHDLKLIDVRISIEEAIDELPNFILQEWINEGEFRSNLVEIEYRTKVNGQLKRHKKSIIPDSYFMITDVERSSRGENSDARFLVEIDMANHDNPSFGREKISPGIAYLRSPQYRNQFGSNSGRWLIITTSEIRLENLLRQARNYGGKDSELFLFTTFEEIFEKNPFIAPIWWMAPEHGKKNKISILGD